MNKRQRKKAERRAVFTGRKWQWWWLAEAFGPPAPLTFELLDKMFIHLKEYNGQQTATLR